MYNLILEKRKELIDNIQKSFELTENSIEKAKWQIGEVRVDSRGIAHECYGYTADGKPRLRRVRKNKGASTTSTDDNKKTNITKEKDVNLDSYSSWNEIWETAKKVAKKWWDEEASKNGGDESEEEWIKKKVSVICAGFGKNVSKKTVIANINSAYQHLDELSKQKMEKNNSDISFQLFDRKSGHSKYYEISPMPNELKNSSFISIIPAQASKSGKKEYVPRIEFKDGEKFSERLFSKKDAINFVKEKILENRNKGKNK